MVSYCRLCGSRDLKLYYTQGNDHQYKFYRCMDCKLVNYDLSTGLGQEKYARVYVNPRDHKHRHNVGPTETYYFIKRHIDTPSKLLDVGCGNGRLLFLAQEDGWRVKGLELSCFLADSIKKAIGIDVEVCDFLEYKIRQNNSFHIVVLRHVLEHLPDLVLAMNKVNSLLKIGGYAVLEFPNVEGLDLRFKRLLRNMGLHRKNYSPDYKPAHCNEFCKESFKVLLAKTGFRLGTWHTYSSKPCLRHFHFNSGNKARAWIRKVDTV